MQQYRPGVGVRRGSVNSHLSDSSESESESESESAPVVSADPLTLPSPNSAANKQLSKLLFAAYTRLDRDSLTGTVTLLSNR